MGAKMNIFIAVYHVFRDLFASLKNIKINFEKGANKRLKEKERQEKEEDLMSEALKNASSLSGKDTNAALKEVLEDRKGNKDELLTFNYVVKDSYGKQIKGSFDAKSKNEVESFLVNEGYQIVSIKLKKTTSIKAIG